MNIWDPKSGIQCTYSFIFQKPNVHIQYLTHFQNPKIFSIRSNFTIFDNTDLGSSPGDPRIHMDLSQGRPRAGLLDTGEAGCSQRVGALLGVLVGP